MRHKPRSRSSPSLAAHGDAAKGGPTAGEKLGKAASPRESASCLSTRSSWSPAGGSPTRCGTASSSGSVARLPELVPMPWGRQRSSAQAAPAADAAGGRPEERRRLAALATAVEGMRLEDAARIALQVRQVEGAAHGERLRRAFRTRAAEVLGAARLPDLPEAQRLLRVVLGMDSDLPLAPWGHSDACPQTSGAPPTRWLCPKRALEERVAHLAHKGAHSLDALGACRRASVELTAEGLMRSKVYEAIMSALARWIEREPLSLFPKNAAALLRLSAAEPSLLEAMEHRLIRRALQPFPPEQLAGYARLVLGLQDAGMVLLDGPGEPQLDPPSAAHYPPLQLSILNALRQMIRDLPISRLAGDFDGPALRLMNARPGIQENVQIVATDRVVDELHRFQTKVLKRDDPLRIQEELLYWGRTTLAMAGASLLDMSEPLRAHVLGPPEELGSLAFCAASVTPGAKELPVEYMGLRAALSDRSREMWQMVTHVFVSLGNAEEAAVAQQLLDQGSA